LPSIYVNACGIWRIGGLEYVCSNADDIIPTKVLTFQQTYTPPERVDSSRRPSGPKWHVLLIIIYVFNNKSLKLINRSVDSWGLGCLIWEVFNGSLPEANKLKSLGKVIIISFL
jgi:SCY1-like protein 1